jgi:hypothetical protein
METTRVSNAKPMTVWCLMMILLVVSVVAVGVALFFTPASGHALVKTTAPAAIR